MKKYLVVYNKWCEEWQRYEAEVFPNLTKEEADDKHDELVTEAEQNDIVSICTIETETVL